MSKGAAIALAALQTVALAYLVSIDARVRAIEGALINRATAHSVALR